jgi:hypothetical protein
MSPLNKWYYLKKQLFDLEVKVQRRSLRYATHRIMVMHPHTKYHWPNTPHYGHASTYQISLTYLERQKSYGPDKLCWEEAEDVEAEVKIRLKQYVSLRSKGRHKYVIYSYSSDQEATQNNSIQSLP